jgi:hypothetical protein
MHSPREQPWEIPPGLHTACQPAARASRLCNGLIRRARPAPPVPTPPDHVSTSSGHFSTRARCLNFLCKLSATPNGQTYSIGSCAPTHCPSSSHPCVCVLYSIPPSPLGRCWLLFLHTATSHRTCACRARSTRCLSRRIPHRLPYNPELPCQRYAHRSRDGTGNLRAQEHETGPSCNGPVSTLSFSSGLRSYLSVISTACPQYP